MSEEVELLESLRHLLATAARVISSLTTTAERATTSGVRAYDAIFERLAASRMSDVHARIVRMRRSNSAVIYSADDMLASLNKSKRTTVEGLNRSATDLPSGASAEEKWSSLLASVTEALDEVEAVLKRLEKERSSYVLSQAYEDVVVGLAMRERLLGAVMAMKKPESAAERQSLKKIIREYDGLKDGLHVANRMLAAQISDRSKARTPPKRRPPSRGRTTAD